MFNGKKDMDEFVDLLSDDVFDVGSPSNGAHVLFQTPNSVHVATRLHELLV